ncbi:MAG: hypothetical protein RJA57_165 [Bacteroidota bacterium]|jgi:predicted O-methyltransferase YrrM
MYGPFKIASAYLSHWLQASSRRGHGIHSPWVYSLVREVCCDRTNYEAYTEVETLRQHLLNDCRIVPVNDYGAGSAHTGRSSRSVRSIARTAVKSRRYGQLLFRLARYANARSILELGTSLGITTSYFARSAADTRVVTLEGAPAIAAIAREHLDRLPGRQVTLLEGCFEDTLDRALGLLGAVDLAFVDGDHRRDATLANVRSIMAYLREDSVLVLDDIHWSRGMEEAWQSIKGWPEVRCTVDLFFIGIVSFRSSFHEKQHYRVRF